jgi:hypothetical protein
LPSAAGFVREIPFSFREYRPIAKKTSNYPLYDFPPHTILASQYIYLLIGFDRSANFIEVMYHETDKGVFPVFPCHEVPNSILIYGDSVRFSVH